jgi:hypothetical protein
MSRIKRTESNVLTILCAYTPDVTSHQIYPSIRLFMLSGGKYIVNNMLVRGDWLHDSEYLLS